MWVRPLSREDPLEKGMAAHSSILAWKTPWTEEPGGLQSMQFQGGGTSEVALVVKNLPANAGDIRDTGLIPGLGRSPGEGHGSPLQCSCLENSMGPGRLQSLG